MQTQTQPDALPPKNSPELLAPAGGMDSALAAFHFGADAVYLGLKRFSARAEAQNFGPDELSSLVAFAHEAPKPRRVYVALNTLLQERDLPEVIRSLGLLEDCGVDGVILQDLAVARLIRQHFPKLALHGSTQMAVHSRQGVEALGRMGFRRVVLARELTLKDITEAARVPDVEIEIFLHGALCYAFSGLCMFSSVLFGKSGNRGACAYPCRDTWRIEDGQFDPALKVGDKGHCFSMKDLALEQLVGELGDAGVASLKIEGRKKSPLYVAATVDHYRHLLDKAPFGAGDRAGAIRTIFSRPWTELFLRGRRNPNTIDTVFAGHRGEFIGRIEALRQSNNGTSSLRFTTSHALEKHDGLQIEILGEERPFGFGIDEMRQVERGRLGPNVVRVRAQSQVDISLPQGAPKLRVGMEIRLSSSNALKRQLDFAQPKVASYRVRTPLCVKAHLNKDHLALTATLLDQGDPAISATTCLSGPFDKAKDPAKTETSIRRTFEKLGETELSLKEFHLNNPEGIFVPISKLNDRRRDLTQSLEGQLKRRRQERLDTILAQVQEESQSAFEFPASDSLHETSMGPKWILRVDDLDKLANFTAQDFSLVDELSVEISNSQSALADFEAFNRSKGVSQDKIRWVLPAITRDEESIALQGNLDELMDRGFRRFEATNLAAFTFLKRAFDMGLDVSSDTQLYALNSQSARLLSEHRISRFTLSVEDGVDNWRQLSPSLRKNAVAIIRQDTPLFISESCPHAAFLKRCPGPQACAFRWMRLSGSRKTEILVYSRDCRTFAINERPLNLTRELKAISELGIGWLRADFTLRPYTPDEVKSLWHAIRAGNPIRGGQSANFHRGL